MNHTLKNLPEDWKLVKLEDVTEIRGNKTINDFEEVAFIPMELVPDSQVYVAFEIRKKGDVKSFTYCEAGDLLLAKITPSVENGKQGIVPENIPNGFALATTEVFPIVSKNIHTLYLFYILKHPKFRNKLIASMIGTTGRQRISKTAVKNLQIPLPPLPEQRKIAEILSSVDSAIQKVDETISKTERLKKGLMQELLTKGIKHERFKDTEIGRLPEEWEVVRLGDVTVYMTGGGTPSTSRPEYWGGNIAWMTSAHIEGKEIWEGQKYITEKGLKNSATNLIPKDNLLVATRVGIGKAAINRIDIAISQDLTGVIVDKEKTTPEFLYWYIARNQAKLKSLAQGSTIKGILRSDLARLKLPLPPIDEQKKIAEILGAVDEKIALEKERKAKLERIKRGLMNDLLTGRKRVVI